MSRETCDLFDLGVPGEPQKTEGDAQAHAGACHPLREPVLQRRYNAVIGRDGVWAGMPELPSRENVLS